MVNQVKDGKDRGCTACVAERPDLGLGVRYTEEFRGVAFYPGRKGERLFCTLPTIRATCYEVRDSHRR